MSHKISTYSTSLRLLLFAVGSYIMLMMNADYLYEVQEHDLFIGTHDFAATTLSQDGGLWIWMGCYLTQYFYHPWLGALLLTAIWTITALLLISAFRLKGNHQLFAWIPVCALLISVLDVGYWLYYMQMPGYWFSHSLSFMTVCLVTWGVSKVVYRFWPHNIAWLIFIVAYFALRQHIPTFAKMGESEPLLSLPFIIAPASVLLLPLIGFLPIADTRRWISITLTTLLLAAFVFASHHFSFRDPNYHAELRMMRAVDECRWDDVIAEAQKADTPTNLMVVYKNIALMHTDRLPEMFSTGNCGILPNSGDSLSVNMAHQDGSMVYYQFGQINYAYRWAMENATDYGLKVKNLKMYVRCAIMNREFDLAAKYLAILNQTTFHRGWAREREPMLTHADALFKSDEYIAISPLLSDDVNILSMDQSLPEKWILTHFSDIIKPATPKLEDLIICTALWTEDDYAFCIHFYNYVNNHPNSTIPPLYQQAAMLLCATEQSPITLNNFPFDPAITARYQSFRNIYDTLARQGMPMQEIGNKMRHDYGDTYWWYYYFYIDFIIY